ncbi:MAG: FHA domain-containing protein [Planctomycetes bacterium]|nr:FHA domain-containing protein [Planctomycetota bacterium]
MKFYLIVAKGAKQGLPIPINVDLFLLGSDNICQLRAPALPARQCAILSRDRKVFVRDFNSGEPTLVNGDLVPPDTECPLHAGDRIEVGMLEFMIQYQEAALSRKDLEEWAAKCLDEQEVHEFFDEDADEFHKASNASEAAQAMIDALNAQKGTVMGRLRIGKESGIVTVRFNDAIMVDESEIALIKKELSQHLNRANLRVLLDFKNVRRMSTSAVTMIRDFSKWLRNLGSRMAICRIRPDFKELLAVFHADQIPHFDDKPAAILANW